MALAAVTLGGCSPAFFLTDYDVATYTRQLGTAEGANDTLAPWHGAVIVITFDASNRIVSSNLRDVFRQRGAFRFTPEMMERAGAEAERELNTWIGPEIASLVQGLDARLERLTQARVELRGAPRFTFDPGNQIVYFGLSVRASVSGRIFVPEANERYDVTLTISDYQVGGSLAFGTPHAQGSQVRLRAQPTPVGISLSGNARREVVDTAVQRLAGPLSAPVDVTRTLSYSRFAVPRLGFVPEPASGAFQVGLSRGPMGRGGTRSFSGAEWGRLDTDGEARVYAGDFNGDGKADVLKLDVAPTARRPAGLMVGLSDGQQLAFSRWATWTTSPRMVLHTGDFNGDGKTDVLIRDQYMSGIWVGLSDGRAFHFSRWSAAIVPQAWQVVVGDFNGDGKTDVLTIEVPLSGVRASGLRVGLSDGASFQFAAAPWATWDTYHEMKVLTGDFNGDGKTDVMKFDVPSGGVAQLGLWVGLSDGGRFTTTEWARWDTYREMKVLAGDFTGDGKTDVMKFDVPLSGTAEYGLWVGASTGTGFSTRQWARWDTSADMVVLAGDFDGGGRADVMQFAVTAPPPPRLRSTYLARPEVPEPTLHVAVRGGGGRLYHGRRESGGGGTFASVPLDQAMAGDPALLSAGGDRLDALAVSTSGRLLHATLRGGAWSQVATPASPPGVTFDAHRPAAVTTAAGQLEVVLRSVDGRLHHVRRLDGAWQAASALAAPRVVAAPPFRDPILVQAANKLVLIFADQASRLVVMAFDLETGLWGSAFNIPGATLAGAPSAAACGDGRVDVAYRRTDGTLVHQPLWAGIDVFRPNVGSSGVSWSPSTTLTGLAGAGDPTLACSGYRRLELLVTGSDRRLRHNHFTWAAGGNDGRNWAPGWQGWSAVGLPLERSGIVPAPRVAGGVAAAVTRDGQVHLMAKAWDTPASAARPMWHNSYRAARWGRWPWAAVHWRGWERSGWPDMVGLPALAVTDRHGDLVVVGADAGLQRAHLGDGIPARFTGGRAVAVPGYLAEPTAIATGPGVVDVVYVGADDRLRHLRYLDGALPIDVAVDPRPGIAAAARPVAVAVGDQLELVAMGSDRSLRHWRYRQGQWSGPSAIPGANNALSAPALIGVGAGRLELFAVLSDQRVHRWRFADAQWSAGVLLPSDFPVRATVFGSLAASSWGDGNVDLVVADEAQGRMYHRHVAPSDLPGRLRPLGVAPPGFAPIGGNAYDVITLSALGPTRLVVLTTGDRRLVSATSSSPPPARILRALRDGEIGPLEWQVDTPPGPLVVIAGMVAIGPAELLAAGIDPAGRLYVNRFRDWRWTGFQLWPGQSPDVQHRPLVPPSLTGR
ncbi:MAG TPA: FG-GAP-like repeat-containing protein [Methylomirabilota bacterium]|nr:FG-GAP-like repeat-containing protein [Methylomirabilota bacterium]